MEETRRREHQGPDDDQHREAESAQDDGYQLDLDDTMSDLDAVIQQAVASVDRTEADVDEDSGDIEIENDDGTETETEAEVVSLSSKEREELERLRSEADALRDRLLRLQADFDNFRKRSDREKEGLRRFAGFDVIKDFLGVIDNLERAHAASGSADDLKQGVSMILRQLDGVLKQQGVSEVEATGERFDPTFHEAVGREESTEIEHPTVTTELQKGYTMHERLLRPAMVHVAMPAPKPPSSESADDATAGEETGSVTESEAAS